MEKSITTEGLREDTWSVLEAMAREGARKVLQQDLEIEVAEYIEAHAGKRDDKGHRRTVRKYIEQEYWNEPMQRARRSRPGILEPFKSTIDAWLEEDRRRRRKQRHTAKRVYDRLVKEKKFSGSYRTVAVYVGQRKREMDRDAQPALPLVHRPGEAQVDFGQADYILQDMLVHGFYLSLSFPYSNTGFVQVVPGENTECLFEALIAIILFIGGILVRLWLDNASPWSGGFWGVASAP